jgi:hypothetical protein
VVIEHATVTTRIDVLLRILTREIDIVASFTEISGVQDACVFIRDVKAARIACIPIRAPFIKLEYGCICCQPPCAGVKCPCPPPAGEEAKTLPVGKVPLAGNAPHPPNNGGA